MPLFALDSPTEIGCHRKRPRLRGLDPREDAFARLSYSPRRASLPSSGFLSSRCSVFSSCSAAYPRCSTHDVTVYRLRLRARGPRPSSVYTQRKTRLIRLLITDLLEFSSLPIQESENS